jgi:hypothetical protein
MSYETNNAEQLVTPEEIAELCETGRDLLAELHGDRTFEQYRLDHGVRSIHDSGYRRELANFVYDNPDYIAEMADDRDYSPTIAEAMIAAQDFVESQVYLDTPGAKPADEFDTALEHTTYFGKLIHQVADEHPGIRFSQLRSELLKAAAELDPHTRSHANHHLTAELRSVRHERGLAAILRSVPGAEVTNSTTQEDANGVDLHVRIRANDVVYEAGVDVKTSLTEIEAAYIRAHKEFDPGRPYYVNQKGIVVMPSFAVDHDFDDTFDLPEDVAASRGPMVVQKLIGAIIRGGGTMRAS